MMLNCPKCGFSQPHDQYCASCGIDMLAFRPKEKPFHRRLFASTVFQLSALAIVILVSFFAVRHQQRLEISRRLSEIENSGSPQIIVRKNDAEKAEFASRSASNESQGDERESASAEETVSASTVPAAMTVGASEHAPGDPSVVPPVAATAATIAATPKPADKTGGAGVSGGGATIRIRYVESPRAYINELGSEAGQNVGGYGPIQYGVVNEWTPRLKAAGGMTNWHALDATEPQSLKVDETTNVFRGPRDDVSGEAYGVWVLTKLLKVDETGATLAIEVSRSLIEPGAAGNALDQVSHVLPEFHVPRGGAVFVSGLLPHRQTALTPAETKLYRADRILHVLSSEPFRSGETDMAIFVELTK